MSGPTFVVFCTRELRLDLTPVQEVLLGVAIDGVQPRDLVGEKREHARRLFGDMNEVDPRVRRILVWRLGRASGKTTLAAALLLFLAWTCALPANAHGHIPVGFIVSATRPLAKIAQNVARELAQEGTLTRFVCEDTTDGFTLRRPDGRVVEVASVAASKGGANLRGRDVVALIVDESEFLGSEAYDSAVTDRDQVSAVMPRLIGHVLLISTPWPTENVTAEYFDRNFGAPSTAFVAVGPSMFVRPSARLAEDIAREMERDAENALREYECKAGGRGGSKLFDPGAVDACVVEGRPLLVHAPPGASLGCGGDLGLERDSSAIVVVSNLGGTFELCEFDEVRPMKDAPLVPSYVINQHFAPLMLRHGARSVTMDAHYRQSAIEHLTARGLRFLDAPTGAEGKYSAYMKLRAAVHGGQLRIPPVPRLVAQLKAITSTPLPGGGTRISSPRRAGGGHGDIVSALALAVWECLDLANRVPGAPGTRVVTVRTPHFGGGLGGRFARGFESHDWVGPMPTAPRSTEPQRVAWRDPSTGEVTTHEIAAPPAAPSVFGGGNGGRGWGGGGRGGWGNGFGV